MSKRIKVRVLASLLVILVLVFSCVPVGVYEVRADQTADVLDGDFTWSPLEPVVGEEVQFRGPDTMNGSTVYSLSWKLNSSGPEIPFSPKGYRFQTTGTHSITILTKTSAGECSEFSKSIFVRKAQPVLSMSFPTDSTYVPGSGEDIAIRFELSDGYTYLDSLPFKFGLYDGSDEIFTDRLEAYLSNEINYQFLSAFLDTLSPGTYSIKWTTDGDVNNEAVPLTELGTLTIAEPPSIIDLTIDPPAAVVETGRQQRFTANVSAAGGADTSVYWSVEDQSSPDTFIDPDGLLTVDPDETSATLRVIATSVFDDTKRDEVTVTVTIPEGVKIDGTSFPDPNFREYVRSFDLDHNGYLSQNEAAQVKVIDITQRSDITDVTGIRYFPNLEALLCDGSGITYLDVSSCTALMRLSCSGTRIMELDVRNNTNLQELRCSGTMLASLDVTRNPLLRELDCTDTSPAYLDLGSAGIGLLSRPMASAVSYAPGGKTFDITGAFLGIRAGRIHILSGGTLDGNILSGYKRGIPVIYEYSCGTNNQNEEILTVTLTLDLPPKTDTSVSIEKDLDKLYDGMPVSLSDSDLIISGSAGAVTYQWAKANGSAWEPLTSVLPTEAGSYRVTAHVDADEDYNEAYSEPKSFVISQADNRWTKDLSVTDWTYGEPAGSPSCESLFGTPGFTYSDSKNGTFTDTNPETAGTWYIKASVPGTANYKSLEAVEEFIIHKAPAPAVTEPDDLKAVQDAILSSVTLPGGWAWVDGSQTVSADNSGYPARLTVDDRNYDYTAAEGYQAQGAFVERMLKVTVSKGQNRWTEEPLIKDWTYGEAANKPSGRAEHGTVEFSYSDSETGTFTAGTPSDAGTWYLKASVAESNEYTGLDEVVSFKIRKADTTVSINKDLNKTYDSKPVSLSDRDITVTGSTGMVSFIWEKKNGSVWEALTAAPSETGTYQVTAHAAENRNYKAADSAKKEFTISRPETSKPAAPGSDTQNKAGSGAVKTGDTSHIWSWLYLAMVSFSSALLLVFRKRRRMNGK
ncbi:hypothetical protein [Murimonas intestini]|uniref:Leucine-rich repeat domain-containing protein n=1 Tax=Murimonas intestini TaxID=1337051 RepID=A0AB73T2E1_9FIRM|nr:hypothetical protein [Murimonas intestini]MCR1841684.1 hypothetical protein [Murimonas intestini]MCR1865501.1 hypothetical protein [Murimonas intestini]MCR1883918.1 hypothetical protein [Murimonas intestini]